MKIRGFNNPSSLVQLWLLSSFAIRADCFGNCIVLRGGLVPIVYRKHLQYTLNRRRTGNEKWFFFPLSTSLNWTLKNAFLKKKPKKCNFWEFIYEISMCMYWVFYINKSVVWDLRMQIESSIEGKINWINQMIFQTQLRKWR